MPRSDASRRSRRVSSAATMSAPTSSAESRGGASSTRPMGVAASTRVPVAGVVMDPIIAAVALGTVTLPAPLARTIGLSRTAVGDVVPSAAARARMRAHDNDPVIAWLGTVAVTLLAAFLRLWHLGSPRAFEFDETYYAKDAWA